MGFTEHLQGTTRTNRAERCRICVLIDTLPDGQQLAEAIKVGSGYGLKRIVDALEADGHRDIYSSAKHHRYVCTRRS